MSPALKSKSRDKSSGRAVKEQQKPSLKPSLLPANGGNVPASAYNPASSTFHAIEAAQPVSRTLPQSNTLFQTVDETEDQSGGSLETVADDDSGSNNDSCSGESDDLKDKVTNVSPPRIETIPGCDTDKRDKIRQKNEKKHQRQREKRAQELHERCRSCLMSRKLENLSQQLVVMGFSAERATMALMLNEGRLEDSVSWLLEGGNEEKKVNASNGACSLKIDISEELARISEIEIKFKCSKQEVERAIVSCEGNVDKAAETLKVQKQETSTAAVKTEDSGDRLLVNGANQVSLSTQIPAIKVQGKDAVAVTIQPREDTDTNYMKVMLTGAALPDNGSRNSQPSRMVQSKLDWARPQASAQVEQRWSAASPCTSVSHPMPSPLRSAVLPAKADARNVMGGTEIKNTLKAASLREPVIMMQRPQSLNTKQNLAATSIGLSTSLPVTRGWYPNGTSNIEIMKSLEQSMGRIGLLTRNYSPHQSLYQQDHHQSSLSSLTDNSGMWGVGSTSGWSSGSNSYASSVATDWATDGSIPQFDYTSIDWSHDLTPLKRNASLKIDRLHETWSTSFMGTKPVKHGYNGRLAGPEDSGFVLNNSLASLGSQEWTSPFTGNDLLSIPRQLVTSPPLHERGF